MIIIIGEIFSIYLIINGNKDKKGPKEEKKKKVLEARLLFSSGPHIC